MNRKLSVVLATKNEEENIERVLESVKAITDEIIIFDEESTDRTVEIAEKFGAKITNHVHTTNFHETKKKATDAATGDWILQLDADEAVSPQLASEVMAVLEGKSSNVPDQNKQKLFQRHQEILERRDGPVGAKTGEIVAYFIPRCNMFLGKPLMHGGVYPDPVIRLHKKGKAFWPAKNVHETMEVLGKVGWLSSDLMHYDSPTLSRYLARANRYTDLTAKDLKSRRVKKNGWNLLGYTIVKPITTFFMLFVRHLGILDGMRGFLWAFFSAMHHPLAFWKYWVNN